MKTTANLGLKKPEGTDVVNIDDFNYNANIIDTELQKRALKTDIPTIPVQSVNGKTGAVALTAADVGAATSAQGIKADTALQSSQLGQAGGPAKQDDFVSHLADDIKQLTTIDTNITNHMTDIMPHDSGLNQYLNNKDANGVYTVVDYKRSDGTEYIKSTLSGGTSPNYTTCTWQFYDKTGANIIQTKTWTLNYDNDGNIVSKVVS